MSVCAQSDHLGDCQWQERPKTFYNNHHYRGNIHKLSLQEVYCPNQKVLTEFVLKTDRAAKEWNYRYRCCSTSTAIIGCTDMRSQERTSNMMVFDLAHNVVECGNNRLLNGFALEAADINLYSGSHAYRFTCCEPSLTDPCLNDEATSTPAQAPCIAQGDLFHGPLTCQFL
jgi:hypothetical protein